MNQLHLLISPQFPVKVKSFLISDGKSKIILARQFIPLPRQELQSLNSTFIVQLTSSPKTEITSFTIGTSYYLYHPYTLIEGEKIFFVLITQKNFNPIEANNILKTITSFIISILNKETHQTSMKEKEFLKKKSFDIFLAIDDIVNPLMGNEGISQGKIIQNLKMESAEALYFNKKQNEKIANAHDQLIKGMHEIERLKYENKYTPNAVSNEDIDKQEEELKEQQRIIDALKEEREREKREIQRGLNLQRHFMSRLHSINREERQRMSEFVNACEAMIQTMMLRELRRIQRDDEDESDENNMGISFVLSPIRIMYTPEEDD